MHQLEVKLRRFIAARPFRPFVVELTSGSRVVVDHPETLIIRAGTAVHLDRRGQPWLFDEDAVVKVGWAPARATRS